MKRFLLGVLVGLLVAGLLVVILIFAALRFGEHKVVVADGSTLVLHLEGEVPEQAPVDLSLPFLQQQQSLTVFDNWMLLRKAAADARIKALVFEPRVLRVGWAKLQEIHAEIVAFKKSGKPVYAYLRGAGSHEYYLATAADKVFMAPEDVLDVRGLHVELMFLKGTLDKVGVQMEFEHVGKYKDAPDMFTKTASSPETREVMNQILDQYFGDLVATIARNRKIQPEEVKRLLDDGPFLGDAALKGGLVDGLVFEDEMLGQLRAQLKLPEIKKIGENDYSTISAASLGLEGTPRIALLTADGEITRGGPRQNDVDGGIKASSLVPLLRQIANDSTIRGVILRVDSPGGDGIASDDILHEAKVLSQKKPLVISMSDLAASGGYFIAMTGDPVIAYPNTLTGSIGVFYGRVNLRGLYDKIGLKKELMSRGKFAAIDSDYGPLSDTERAKLRQEIEVFYKGFVERVSAGRKRPYAEMESLAQGRVWLGEQAKTNGLVDELGGLDRALELVRERAKIGTAEKISIVTYPEKRSLWDVLFSRTDENAQAEAQIAARLRTFLGRLPVRSLAQGGVMRLLPYTVDVR
jgi:protease-4